MNDKIKDYYFKYHKEKTYKHVMQVADVAIKLAEVYHLDKEKCYLAAILHDISAIMSADDMYQLAIQRHLLIDPAEEKYHFLLHQRISKMIAQEEFHIENQDILSAIECHTTLKKHPSQYDMVLFLADKIAWDQKSIPPYDKELKEAIAISLEEGCYTFMKYQLDHQLLKMPHHWVIEAYDYFKKILKKS